MLAETYEKFKLQLKAQKTSNEQLPEVVQTSDEQVHYICSYNHYPIKDDDIKSGLIHNDVYNTDELTHEFEYGLFEDIIKSKQLMADLKQIDEYEASIQEQLNNEFDYFPLKEFKNAGVIPNQNDPGLKLAADAELFEIEQQVLQQQPDEKHASKVSHMHHQHDSDSTKDRYYHHVHTINCPAMSCIMMKSKKYYFHLLLKCLAKKMQKHYMLMKTSMNGKLIHILMKV